MPKDYPAFIIDRSRRSLISIGFPPLLKKAMKAYLFGEEMSVRRGGMPLDDQIAAVDDVLRMAESQRPRMVDMNGVGATDRFVSALSDARESLLRLQKLIYNG